jgi:hypothetical protein
VNVAVDGWGQNNTFTNNRLEVNAPGPESGCRTEAGAYATNHYTALDCTGRSRPDGAQGDARPD